MSGKTRYEELSEQCNDWHKKYPIVWELFERFTFDRINKGFKHYSAYAIFEKIRWHLDKPKVDPEKEFKLNNNYRPFYSRRFMKKYPQYDGFFRTRTQTSKNTDATNRPELTPMDFQ